jgi:hypothetical protein
VPATGIVEWIVMVVTFPVVVVWRSRASEELIEPLHSHREKMKLLNSLPQNFQNLLKTSCPAKSVLTCLNCNYNDDDDDDKTRTPYTVVLFFWNLSSNGRDKKRTEWIPGPKIPLEELPAAAEERFVRTHKRRTTPSTSLITCLQECLNLGDCTLRQSSFQANEKMNLINSQEKKADTRLPR